MSAARLAASLLWALVAGACAGEITGYQAAAGGDGGSVDAALPGPDGGAAADATGADPDAPPPAVDAAPGDPDAIVVPPDAAPTPDAPDLGACPQAATVDYEGWDPAWVAPSSGDARQIILLSNIKNLHFRYATVEFDFRTTTVEGVWTSVFELKNQATGPGYPYISRYGAFHTKNSAPKKIVLTEFNEDGGYAQTKPVFAVKPSTQYHVTYTYDSVTGIASLTLDEEGGASVTAIGEARSSLVPAGSGLKLFVGLDEFGADWKHGVRPPWGWTFSNLHVRLEPGGPFGPGGPPCP